MADDTAHLLADDAFEDQVFRGGDFAEADLGGKELVRCTFKNVKLAQTRWREARLEDCTFDACDLSRMVPAELVARGVTFVGCKMMGIDWSVLGKFPVLGFRACDLRYCTFASLKLRKTVFESCNLGEAQFVDTDLGEAVFDGSQLGGARFERCDLRKASFVEVADLALEASGNQLRGARIPLEAAVLLARSFGLEVLGF